MAQKIGKKDEKRTSINYTSKFNAWQKRIEKEEACRQSWENVWGSLSGSVTDLLTEQEKREIIKDYDKKMANKPKRKTEDQRTNYAKASPSRRPITSADYGLRAGPEYIVDILQEKRGKKCIYKVFGWPLGAI